MSLCTFENTFKNWLSAEILRDSTKIDFDFKFLEGNEVDEFLRTVKQIEADTLLKKIYTKLYNEPHNGIEKSRTDDNCYIYRRSKLSLMFLESFEQIYILRQGKLILETEVEFLSFNN